MLLLSHLWLVSCSFFWTRDPRPANHLKIRSWCHLLVMITEQNQIFIYPWGKNKSQTNWTCRKKYIKKWIWNDVNVPSNVCDKLLSITYEWHYIISCCWSGSKYVMSANGTLAFVGSSRLKCSRSTFLLALCFHSW